MQTSSPPTIPSSSNTTTSSVEKIVKTKTLIVENSVSFFGATPIGQQSVGFSFDSIVALLRAYGLSPPFYSQVSELIGTGATTPAFQGSSVSITPDGTTLAIGGFQDNSGIGAVWIFIFNGTAWVQQGQKLVGTGAIGAANQGQSVSLSTDGNTLVVGGPLDNSNAGAAWVFTRSGITWSQQGAKLVGTGATGNANQGYSVAISEDGNTLVSGGITDTSGLGATWIFVRSGTSWAQQGAKLVGTGNTGNSAQGTAVALSADGNTLVVGGSNDHGAIGAVWVFVRSGVVWAQQGSKLVGIHTGSSQQGCSVDIAGDTLVFGGSSDDTAGATWIFTRLAGVWTQQGSKLVGTGYIGFANQGNSVAISTDGNTVVSGAPFDNGGIGAAWVFSQINGLWAQSGPKLIGTGYIGNSEEGWSVTTNADGSIVVIGGFQDNGTIGATWVFNN